VPRRLARVAAAAHRSTGPLPWGTRTAGSACTRAVHCPPPPLATLVCVFVFVTGEGVCCVALFMASSAGALNRCARQAMGTAHDGGGGGAERWAPAPSTGELSALRAANERGLAGGALAGGALMAIDQKVLIAAVADDIQARHCMAQPLAELCGGCVAALKVSWCRSSPAWPGGHRPRGAAVRGLHRARGRRGRPLARGLRGGRARAIIRPAPL
jgi:hypothetical protein